MMDSDKKDKKKDKRKGEKRDKTRRKDDKVTKTKENSSDSEIRKFLVDNHAKVNLTSLEITKIIGCGSFGMVSLALFGRKRTQNGVRLPPFCLKSVDKGRVVGVEQIAHVISEHQILQALEDHPNVVQLYGSFHDTKYVHYITEFIPGGELFHRIYPNTPNNTGLNVDEARFYFSEVVSVFEYMHARGIVYRDLKPENIMIGASGHVKIVDFGFAKNLNDHGGKATTICGTMEYLAPEMAQAHLVTSKGLNSKKTFSHAIPVDRWALGVFLFELLNAVSPFSAYANEPLELCKAILKGKILWPEKMDGLGRDIVKRLLKKEPSQRLGGDSPIHAHPFLQQDSQGNPISWEDVKSNTLIPPWKPKLNGPLDTGKFKPPVSEEILSFGSVAADNKLQDYYTKVFGPLQKNPPPDFRCFADKK